MAQATNSNAKEYAKKMTESVRQMLQTAFGEAFSAAKGDDWFAQLQADDDAAAKDNEKKQILKNIGAPEEMDFQACIKIIVFRKEYRELLLSHYRLEDKAKVIGSLCNELKDYRNRIAHEGEADVDAKTHEQAMENMKYLAGLFSAVRDEAGNSYKDEVERQYYDYKSTLKTQFYAFADNFDTERYSEDKLTAGATYLQLQVGVEEHKRGFYSADFDGDKTKILNFIVNMGSDGQAPAKADKAKKKPLIAVAAVIAVLVIAALVFGITRGGNKTAAPETNESTTSAEDYVPTGEDACKALEDMMETAKNGDVETLLPSLVDNYDALSEEDKEACKEFFENYKTASVGYDKQRAVMLFQLDDASFALCHVIYSVDKANNNVNREYGNSVVRYRDGEWKLYADYQAAPVEWDSLFEQAVDNGMQTALKQVGRQDLIEIYQNERDSKVRIDPDGNIPLFLNNTALYDDYVDVLPVAVIETDDQICVLTYLMNGTDATTTFGKYWHYYDDNANNVTMMAPETQWTIVYNNKRYFSISINRTVPAHTGVYYVVGTSKDAFLEDYRTLADWPENWAVGFTPAKEQ